MNTVVDLVLDRARIATLDAGRPSADAVAIGGGRILAVGSSADLEPYRQRARRIIDMDGAFVLPGLVDSHCHPDGEAAKRGRWHDLSGHAGGLDALLRRIRLFDLEAPAGRWFLGYRYDEALIGGQHPSRQCLDACAPGRPVFLLRRDAHVGVASTAAFSATETPLDGADVPRDQLDIGTDGYATGITRGRRTQHFVRRANAGQTVDDFLAGFPSVIDDITRYGLTGIHNALTASDAIDAYRRLDAAGQLPIRVAIMADGRDEQLLADLLARGERFGQGSDRVRMLGVEFGFDGSTGGRSAAYHAPYRPVDGDGAEVRGFVNYGADEIAERARAVRRAGLQFCLTGNGDRGIDLALDAIEASDEAGRGGPPPRVEHCCCMPPATQERYARSGAIVSSAAAFIHDLGDSYLRQRPESDVPWLWPHRSMMERGALVCTHTDAPVCDRNPFTTLEAIVTRRTRSGAVIAADEALDRVAALKTYTTNPAIAAGLGDALGMIAPGRLADLSVLDTDLLACPAERIGQTIAEMTIVNGDIVFDRNGGDRPRKSALHG